VTARTAGLGSGPAKAGRRRRPARQPRTPGAHALEGAGTLITTRASFSISSMLNGGRALLHVELKATSLVRTGLRARLRLWDVSCLANADAWP
jgi:hypothetical protein